ncbi:hypothetical protein M9Y10_041434 [Tritrichomonas musculus]|uniref:Uncharacterized protein n=1 Tax=Tritrichomonas musculus TaxID=1915356 RepID=A0ABR2K4B1_9EUKA
MEQKLPNAFTIMNSSSDTLKKSSNLSIMCKDLGSLKDIFNDILLNINNKNKNPHALTFKQLNHDHEKETSNILQNKLNEWIIELENKMDEINANELKEEYKEEERKINDRKKILLGKLNKAKQDSLDDDMIMLNEMIEYIENAYTSSSFEQMKQSIDKDELNVDRMIKNINSYEKNIKFGEIPFPLKKKSMAHQSSTHEKICSIYLNYSHTINLLNTIQKLDTNLNALDVLYELYHQKDLDKKELAQFLYSNLKDSDESKKNIIINKTKSYARALTIQHLLPFERTDHKLLTNPEELKNEFEKYINRTEYDEDLEYWAGKISIKYHPKDMILIPKYTPLDIHHLFINGTSPGILFKENIFPSPELLNHLSHIDPSQYENLEKYLNEVSKISLKVLCNITINENFIETIERQNQILKKDIFRIILLLYPICKAQDSRKPFRFSDEDLFFVKRNWLKQIDLCAKYPSLTFWLISNVECQKN